MSKYICESCWTEQDESDWCQACHVKTGLFQPVITIADLKRRWNKDNSVEPTQMGISLHDAAHGEPLDEYPINEELMAQMDAEELASLQDRSDHDFAEQYANGSSMTDWKQWAEKQYDAAAPTYGTDELAAHWADDYYGGTGSYNQNKFLKYATTNSGNTNYPTAYNNVKKFVPPDPPRRAKAWKDHNFWFIGDIHDNVDEYLKAIKDIREIDPSAVTICIGDIGLGRGSELPQLGDKDFFIQGNHDDIDACMKHPNFLGKFGYKHGVFYMGGAKSKGLGFQGEELTDEELAEAVKLYAHVKPEIVITHDCPTSIQERYHSFTSKPKKSRTNEALEEMWQIHNPNVWAYGHYHVGRKENYDGTDWICVSPLESHQIRLAWVTGVKEYQKPSKPLQKGWVGSAVDGVTNAVKGMFGK